MTQQFLEWLTYWLTWVYRDNAAGYVYVMSVVMRMFPAPPGPPTVTLLREDGTMLVYGCNPPAKTAPDVVSCEFTAKIAGQPDQVVTMDVGGDKPEIKANDNDSVSLTCVMIDDADNRSPASPAYTFTATDTIAPGAPDAPSVELLREE